MSETVEKIIIRHKIEEADDDYHGGAWKVAYADFMTAMMAFFLLMWIVSTAEEQRLEGLADYFTPTLTPASGKGGTGAFAGLAPETRGMLAARIKEQATGQNDPVGAPNGSAENPWADIEASDPSGSETSALVPTNRPLYMPGIDSEPSFAERQNGTPGEKTDTTEAARDAAVLEAVAQQIMDALQEDTDLADLGSSVTIAQTDTALEIEILEQEDVPMFPLGAADFSAPVAILVARVGSTIADLPNRIVISGHTDGAPFSRDDYTNWELSTDRAHATRRALMEVGVQADRFARVSGMADQDLLMPDDPLHPSNRRISIHLLLEGEEVE